MRRLLALLVFFCATIARASAGPGCSNPDALGVSREIAVGAPGGLRIGQKTYPRTLALAEGEVVLTLDDGPLPGLTDRVLNTLAAECVRATFFFIGRNAAAHPQIAQRALKDGHTIGHHSWSHPAQTLRGLSPGDAIREIQRGMDATQRAAGQGPLVGDRPAVPFFRFPGFADTPETLAWLDAHERRALQEALQANGQNPDAAARQLGLSARQLRLRLMRLGLSVPTAP